MNNLYAIMLNITFTAGGKRFVPVFSNTKEACQAHAEQLAKELGYVPVPGGWTDPEINLAVDGVQPLHLVEMDEKTCLERVLAYQAHRKHALRLVW